MIASKSCVGVAGRPGAHFPRKTTVFEIFLLVIGLLVLLVGGELLVRGSSHIATSLGMSKLMVGLTVVAFGTSAPEMAICVDAALAGKPDIALGNIVGSNITNTLLILGLTATVVPIVIQRQIIHREAAIMILASILFLFLASDSQLTTNDGFVLLACMCAFLLWQIFLQYRTSKDLHRHQQTEGIEWASGISVWRDIAYVGAGIACLWFGAGWLVDGASALAEQMGVSKLVIGLTIVALGSSAPEIVTSLVAAFRGFSDMAVGNVIGSNIANLFLVAGLTSSIAGQVDIPKEALTFDIPILLFSAILCIPVFVTGHRIDRWEGLMFLAGFGAFNYVLFSKPQLNEQYPNWELVLWPIAGVLFLGTLFAIFQHARNQEQK